MLWTLTSDVTFTRKTDTGETSENFATLAVDGIYLISGETHMWALAIGGGRILESASNSQGNTKTRWWPNTYPLDYPPIDYYWHIAGLSDLQTCKAFRQGLKKERAEWDIPGGLISDLQSRQLAKPIIATHDIEKRLIESLEDIYGKRRESRPDKIVIKAPTLVIPAIEVRGIEAVPAPTLVTHTIEVRGIEAFGDSDGT